MQEIGEMFVSKKRAYPAISNTHRDMKMITAMMIMFSFRRVCTFGLL